MIQTSTDDTEAAVYRLNGKIKKKQAGSVSIASVSWRMTFIEQSIITSLTVPGGSSNHRPQKPPKPDVWDYVAVGVLLTSSLMIDWNSLYLSTQLVVKSRQELEAPLPIAFELVADEGKDRFFSFLCRPLRPLYMQWANENARGRGLSIFS